MKDLIKLKSRVCEKELLEEADVVVKSIDFTEGYGWAITFE